MTHNIVYATDKSYEMQTFVSLYSLVSAADEEEYSIFIIGSDLTNEFKENVCQLENHSNVFQIEFLQIDTDSFDNLPEPRHLSKGIYYRLMLNSILPVSDEYVLYIDSDTLIIESIADIFNLELNDAVIAAAPHYELASYFYGLSINTRWYQTGVLYIDLGSWEKKEIEANLFEFIKKEDITKVPIQKALNTGIDEELRCPIEPKYNYTNDWMRASRRRNIDIRPKIIHFAGSRKPWYHKTVHPYKQSWFEVLSETPYAGYSPPDKNIPNSIIKKFNKILPGVLTIEVIRKRIT